MYGRPEAEVYSTPSPEFISRNSVTSIIATMLVWDHSTRMYGSEAMRYPRTPPLNVFKQPDPLRCWKILEVEYPTVAQIARDVLAIPTTGVVERLFNVGRDACHYRRNRLDGKTIKMIMVIKYLNASRESL